jgi:hypothetical protein
MRLPRIAPEWPRKADKYPFLKPSFGTHHFRAGRAEALHFDRGLVNGKAVLGYLSHKPLDDGALMHFVNTAAIVAYCENGTIMSAPRVSARHVSVLRLESMCETVSHQPT